MVLSNKRLKQKLRAELAESGAKKSLSNNSNSDSTNLETSKSLKQLLDSSAPKPRLNKRERRRKTLNLQTPEIFEKSSNDEIKVAYVGETENGKGTKRKRDEKKKKKNAGVDGELGLKEEGVELKKEVLVPTKNAKKKKKKKKKKKSKGKGEKQETQSEIEIGAISEHSVPENVENDNSQGNEENTKKVYAGGIPFYSTEDDIRSYFDHCGTITDIDCMTFPESGKFRGIAIITFKTEEAAKRALAIDGSDMGGLYLKIQPYKSTRPMKTYSTDFSPPVMVGYNRIYAGNLSWDITEDDLKQLFSDCSISTIRFGEDKETGEFKGYAHVDFADNASLTKALKLDQSVVCGRPVRIRCAVPSKKGDIQNRGSASATAEAKTEVENNSKAEYEYEYENENNIGVVGSGKHKRRTCYVCGEKGHIVSACPNQQQATSFANVESETENEKVENGKIDTESGKIEMNESTNAGVGSGKLKRRTCYLCKQKGHLFSECPNKEAVEQKNASGS